MESIHFFTEGIDYKLKNKTKVRNWIREVINLHNKRTSDINYIFTNDEYLHKINKEYLKHDTFTDIITFDQSTNTETIKGDIYISIPRIIENSKNLQQTQEEELNRVIIHGVLHLLGYSDKTKSEKEEMRKKENHYLALRFNSKE